MKGGGEMSGKELCTQCELMIALLKSGKSAEVIRILEDAAARIKGTAG